MLENFHSISEFVCSSDLPTDERDANFINSQGIKVVISLHDLPKKIKQNFDELGVERISFILIDYSAPTLSQAQDFIKVMQECMVLGKKVLIHCLAGCGRTGTMLAVYYIGLYGWSYEKARWDILTIESPAQHKFLHDNEKELQEFGCTIKQV